MERSILKKKQKKHSDAEQYCIPPHNTQSCELLFLNFATGVDHNLIN